MSNVLVNISDDSWKYVAISAKLNYQQKISRYEKALQTKKTLSNKLGLDVVKSQSRDKKVSDVYTS